MKKVRSSRAVWAARVARFVDSGLDAKTFASREGVTKRRLMWWRWRLAKDGAAGTSPILPGAASFVEILGVEQQQQAMPLDVVLRCGVVVRVPDIFNPATLLRLVDLLDRGAA